MGKTPDGPNICRIAFLERLLNDEIMQLIMLGIEKCTITMFCWQIYTKTLANKNSYLIATLSMQRI